MDKKAVISEILDVKDAYFSQVRSQVMDDNGGVRSQPITSLRVLLLLI